jgi:endonuclease/exonuclease/phosphatase family metal-dependent hydrolase
MIPVKIEPIELAIAPRLLIASRARLTTMTGIRVLSYNVRYANRGDHHDAWHDRRDAVGRLVRFHRPDVVAFQEPLPGQRRDLRERLPSYEFVGRGREPDGGGEGCPIAARADRWEVVDDDTFWLSETPTEPSADWGAAHPRIATWARVRAVDGTAELLVVNTHFDHVSARARRESARLVRERLPEMAGPGAGGSAGPPPIALVGDLNCTPGSNPHRILLGDDPESDASGQAADDRLPLRDAAAVADLRHGPETSLTDFARLIDGRRIDHALVSQAVDVEAFATLTDRDDRGRYPSDHLPVLTRASL